MGFGAKHSERSSERRSPNPPPAGGINSEIAEVPRLIYATFKSRIDA